MLDPGSGKEPAAPPALSVVVPVYDEAGNVAALHEEISRVLASSQTSWEILFVDDGSRDGTASELERLARLDPHLRVLRLTCNHGQTAALQAGFDHARGQVIVTLDGDLQNDPRDIPKLLAEIDAGYDIVSGWRRRRQDRWLTRRLPSVVANALIARLTRVRVHDHGCALKAYRREVTERTSLYSDMHRFVVIVASMTGARCREIVVNHRPRRAGRSKYGLGRIWRVLLDLIVLVTLTRFTGQPARWFLLVSLPFGLAAALSLGFTAYAYLAPASASAPPVIALGTSLLCCFAVGHLLLLAVLGELVVATGDYRQDDAALVRVREGGE